MFPVGDFKHRHENVCNWCTHIYLEASDLFTFQKVMNHELLLVNKLLNANKLALDIDNFSFIFQTSRLHLKKDKIIQQKNI